MQAAPSAQPVGEKTDEPPKPTSEEPILYSTQRENMYTTKVTLGGDRLRKYFPDITMTPLAIVESIYSALEERRQREERVKQKSDLLHTDKSSTTR